MNTGLIQHMVAYYEHRTARLNPTPITQHMVEHRTARLHPTLLSHSICMVAYYEHRTARLNPTLTKFLLDLCS